MNIEIYGAGSGNKGALLMIHAVVRELADRGIAVRFGVDPEERLSFEDRAQLGILYIPSLLPHIPFRRLRVYFNSLFRRITAFADRRLRSDQQEMLGLLPRCKCDAMIDISGYRYGDYWHVRHARKFSSIARDYHKRGKPVFLLPQMFGEFKRSAVVKALKPGFEAAALIFAREQESLEQLKDSFPVASKLRCVPDITIPLKGCGPETQGSTMGGDRQVSAAIVPNYRVVMKAPDGGQSYRVFLRSTHEFFEASGLQPFFVIHESTGKDRQLAEEVLEGLGINPTSAIYENGSPLETKAFLSSQEVIVSSRYHACVGGLSSGVPVLSYGWAHKYQALHRDFGVEDWILNAQNPAEDAKAKIKSILADRPSFSAALIAKREELVNRVESMWDEVFEVLNSLT